MPIEGAGVQRLVHVSGRPSALAEARTVRSQLSDLQIFESCNPEKKAHTQTRRRVTE